MNGTPGLLPLLVIAPRAGLATLGIARPGAGRSSVSLVCEDLPRGDRAATAAITAELARLGRAGLLGLGPGSSLALLAACTSSSVVACALVGGALVLERLSAERPSQPLELALNLGCPLFVFHGMADPEFPPAHVAFARAKLDQFARDATFESVEDAGAGWCDPAHPGYRPESAGRAVERALAALATAAEQEP
ncbi:MAG: dienelactone hydrolase family protein [Planctomycetes bacterium]|nr:dienelactone hydrolase family protein [Planctomycetota bacterium]